MEFIKEFWVYMKERKKLWLLPLFVIFMLVGVLLIIAKGSVIAPFIYTLF